MQECFLDAIHNKKAIPSDMSGVSSGDRALSTTRIRGRRTDISASAMKGEGKETQSLRRTGIFDLAKTAGHKKSRKKDGGQQRKARRRSVGVSVQRMGRHVIRYRTHSCLDPTRIRRVVRRPGLLIYCRRSALITARLRRRKSKRSGRKAVNYRLILPPKRFSRRFTALGNRRGRNIKLPRENSLVRRGKNLEGITDKPEATKHHENQRDVKKRGLSRVKEGTRRETVRTSDRSRKSLPLYANDDKQLEPMPMSEWKIVFHKKVTQKESEATELECDAAATDVQREEAGVTRPEIVSHPSGIHTGVHHVSRSPWPSERWQMYRKELVTPGTMLWRFPVMPGRYVKRTVKCVPRGPAPRRAHYQSLFCFEVLACKVTIHQRPCVLKASRGKKLRDDAGVVHLNSLHLTIPDMAGGSRQRNFIFNHQPQSFQHRKRNAADNSQSTNIPSRQLTYARPGHQRSGSGDELNKTTAEQNFILPDVEQGISLSRSYEKSRGHPGAPSASNSERRHHLPSSGLVSQTDGTLECSPHNKSELRARNKFMELLRRKEPVSDSWTESSGSDDVTNSDRDDVQPSDISRRTRRSKRHNKKTKRVQKTSETNNSELLKVDCLRPDILAELLRLQHPKTKDRLSSAEVSSKTSKKKKRKRKGSHKSAENRRVKEQLLLTLSRNTAFWYDVTSRLQTVTGRPEVKLADETSAAASSTSQTKRKLKAAVRSMRDLPESEIPKASGGGGSDGQPPRLPPIPQSSRPSKFKTAASHLITAERNYYSFLPPLTSPWSEALQDLLPSIRQDSEDSGVGGEKRPARRRPRRGGKKKGEEGGLDDPGQTVVSTVGDSRVGSSRRSGSSHSSKPTSARSSKSSSSHRRLHDPLSYDPKEFLGANNPPEDGSELAKLQEALGPGVGGATLTEAEVFWFSLPRSPSHRAAVFTLPVQITRLLGMSPIDYLRKYMRLRTSRRQLYSMVFTRHRDLESIRVERMLTSDFGEALGNALGGSVTEEQLARLSALVTLPDLALDRDYFILISAFAERLFCYELLAAPDVHVEPRDLVEQLDFQQLDERLEGVTLDPQLHQVLTTIRDLG